MGDTLQRKRKRACLSSYSHLGILQPLTRYEERFFMPVIRVSDYHVSGATRNEDWPDSPTVNHQQGQGEDYVCSRNEEL